MTFRSAAARRRADLLRQAHEAHAAGREGEAARLRAEGLALMTCWDRALYALAEHYLALGRHYYGGFIDDLSEECIRGCGSSRTFRRVVVEIFDVEHRYSPGVNAMVQAAKEGRLADIMRGATDGFGDRDPGATLAGGRCW